MDNEVNEQFSEETKSEPDSSTEQMDDVEPQKEQRVISSRWDLKESWAELEAATPTTVNEGDIVEGVVVDCQDRGVVVDIGAKYEGMIPISEFANKEELPQRDEQIEVAVINIDEDSGMIRLSKQRADYERVWRHIEQAQEKGEVVTAMVTDRVKGGLRVDLGVSGFVPASHVATRDVRRLDRFIGKTLRLKILEADRASNQLVLSHREAIEEQRQRRREATLSRLDEGVVCEGKVQNLTNYGAFIDLGGVDGLLHISEMSWAHIRHPSDLLKPGDIIRVVVLKIEEDGQRISLGRRQILPDPWKEAPSRLNEGDIVQTQITRIVATGAFARLADSEIEGFIPISQMSVTRIKSPEEVLQEGQQATAKIIELRPQARKMTLSLIEAQHEQQRAEYQEFMRGQQASGITLGERFGDVLQEAKASLAESSEGPAEETNEELSEEDTEAKEAPGEEDTEAKVAEEDSSEDNG